MRSTASAASSHQKSSETKLFAEPNRVPEVQIEIPQQLQQESAVPYSPDAAQSPDALLASPRISSRTSGILTPRAKVAAAAVAKGARKLSGIPRAISKELGQTLSDVADSMLEVIDGPEKAVMPAVSDPEAEQAKIDALFREIVMEKAARKRAKDSQRASSSSDGGGSLAA
mmetsp:Transcript_35274/g.92566  ORF Transcript_35274/g.92566 Transcript_35274/m.92566 type:complete len:171 (-) Transcript_35274:279-791(-)